MYAIFRNGKQITKPCYTREEAWDAVETLEWGFASVTCEPIRPPSVVQQILEQAGVCQTCNGDPDVCASIPGLRHCERANR